MLCGEHLDEEDVFQTGREEWCAFWETPSAGTSFVSAFGKPGMLFGKHLDEKGVFQFRQAQRHSFRETSLASMFSSILASEGGGGRAPCKTS